MEGYLDAGLNYAIKYDPTEGHSRGQERLNGVITNVIITQTVDQSGQIQDHVNQLALVLAFNDLIEGHLSSSALDNWLQAKIYEVGKQVNGIPLSYWDNGVPLLQS